MKNEKQTKKQKHAAKSWDFKFRGGINGIDVAEIAETLSRKNPVAVVTLLPTEKKQAQRVYCSDTPFFTGQVPLGV